MAALLVSVTVLFLIAATNTNILGPSDQSQELFVYRQQIYVVHDLLQKECPELLRSKRDAYDDESMSLEIAKLVYAKLKNALKVCRSRDAKARSTTTSETKTVPATSTIYTTVEPKTPEDCQTLYEQGTTAAGVYLIDPLPETMKPFKVWCDFFDKHGWTVFQKRFDGSVDFYRGWAEYQAGFGDVTGEYWLGLDKIYALTLSNQLLNIFAKTSSGESQSGTWNGFYIHNETDDYRLTVNATGYNGTLDSYSFTHHNNMAFTTKDKDRDEYKFNNCAVQYHGAWWYKNCYLSNLNGMYNANKEKGIIWYGFSQDLTATVMRVSRD